MVGPWGTCMINDISIGTQCRVHDPGLGSSRLAASILASYILLTNRKSVYDGMEIGHVSACIHVTSLNEILPEKISKIGCPSPSLRPTGALSTVDQRQVGKLS